MAERAKAVQESFEERQQDTSEALAQLMQEIEANERRKQEQAAKGFDGLIYFVYATLLEAGIPQPEAVSQKIRAAFVEHPSWLRSEKDLRDLRQKITFALYAQEDDLDKVTSTVDHLFTLLMKAQSGQG
jgi:type I restriction enzyme, R subunit